ncbi:MAG: phosphoenolpyruvate synthase [Chloroflexi bacterium]|nr:phosphoenolpyruvate synthase [Chloroflexota bacterium]
MSFIQTIAELDRTDLSTAGGKGANLGALLRAGLPVPGGFVITMEGYRAFVADNHLVADLRRILDDTRMDDPASLESAAERIRTHFRSGQLSTALSDEIRQAYRALHNPPMAVAVRSSATAEDLPELSFAGQQDTYLNVLGEDALLEAVRCCWASLWTARAIGYRARNAIPQNDLALAVVVQQMVSSEVSGVLFTANPLTGKRSETVIDAIFGLGEALVSGQVEPDHYVVESASGHILSKTLGAKALRIQAQAGGGTTSLRQDASGHPALSDEQIRALTHLGQQAAAHFGSPQDLEWAWANGQMYVLQSRPITSLYPLQEGVTAEPLEAFLFFGVWQGMLDPYTPLGQDIFNLLIYGLAELVNVKINPGEQRTLLAAGERLFVNLTGLLHNSLGRKVLNLFLPVMDPASGSIAAELQSDPRLAVTGGIHLRNGWRLLRSLSPFGRNILFNLLFPSQGYARLQHRIDKTCAQVKEQCAQAQSLVEVATTIDHLSTRMIKNLMPILVAAVASGQGVPLQLLIRLAAKIPSGPDLIMDLSRGLPHNVTIEMDLALWETARALQSEPAVAAYFAGTNTTHLVTDYRRGALAPTAQRAIAHFLERYGMRGIGEIDLGRPRWNEDPTPVFQMLKSYLQIDETRAPDVVFQRGVEKAQQAEQQLIAAIAASPGGWLKAIGARFLVKRFRKLGGLRESPKFTIIQLMGIFRQALRAASQKWVTQGVFAHAEDVFFLRLCEIKALESRDARATQALIAERKAAYQRELRRKRSPRILLSDGTAYYDATSPAGEENENTLSGSPVSAGTVEGIVHVVLDPHGAQLRPGEILVCPATDPAWTPLFLSAGGLVMEVGGMMTHGSVVAREYGIPAVVGVQQATERLKTGQRVRVDGLSGRVTILPAEPRTS